MPDKKAHYSLEIDDAENGAVLNYSEIGFYTEPKIVATVTENIFAFAIVTDKTVESAKIFAINNDGEKTTARVDIQIIGY